MGFADDYTMCGLSCPFEGFGLKYVWLGRALTHAFKTQWSPGPIAPRRSCQATIDLLPLEMIKALIFDLDNCLAPANEVGEQLIEPAFTAIRNANRGTVSEETLREAFSECWRHPFDFVATKYGFSNEMVSAGGDAFSQMEVETPMKGYPDLNVLPELTPDLYLVTSGFRRLQQSKIKALGFEHLFKAVFIDAVDEPERKGKEGIFRSILGAEGLRPEEVIVVGDNPDSEIEGGNRLGIRTVQILRPGVPRGDMATHHISTLAELKAMVQNPGGRA